MLKYNTERMNQFINDYTNYNDEIIKSLKRITDEFINIEEILQTPKSTKEVPKIIEYMKNETNEIENEKEMYVNKLKFAQSTYNNVIENISTMIGDENVK